jgi:membrane protein
MAADPRPDSESDRKGPSPAPELREPRLGDPGVADLSRRDYVAIAIRGVKSAMADNVTNLAQAIAYCAFLAIPSALMVGLGLFSLLASKSTISTLLGHLSTVLPGSVISLLGSSLTRTTEAHTGGIVMIVVGLVVALWSLTGAMQTVMWAMNIAFERDETRGFVKKRLTALIMLACCVVAFTLVFGLLILGPFLSDWVGRSVGSPTVVKWIWWTAQWPILIVGLLTMFGIVLYLAPNISPARWSFVSPGAIVAVAVWLLASAGFAFYASRFSSYNKTWGSLSAVIIMLTWLWLSALALLVGGEINAEAERSRELRQGKDAGGRIQAQT